MDFSSGSAMTRREQELSLSDAVAQRDQEFFLAAVLRHSGIRIALHEDLGGFHSKGSQVML